MLKNKILSVYVVSFIALIIFAFYDLQISLAILNDKQLFSLLFEYVGEIPIYLMGTISSLLLIKTAKFENKFILYLHNLALSLFFGLAIFMGSFLVANYLGIEKNGLLLVALALVLLSLILYYYFRDGVDYDLRRTALMGISLFFVVFITFNLMKFAWGRERLRHMAGDYSTFTPWYLPQGWASGNDYMSFPSGHAACASAIVWFTLLPKIRNKQLFNYISIFWIVSVMYSRVVMGAHFASDVTVGMLITLSWYLTLKRIFNLKAD